MANQEEPRFLTKEQIDQLSRELAEAISKTLARSAAFGGLIRLPGYNCTGDEFECLNEYHCHAPHGCTGKFGCPGSFICTQIFGG